MKTKVAIFLMCTLFSTTLWSRDALNKPTVKSPFDSYHPLVRSYARFEQGGNYLQETCKIFKDDLSCKLSKQYHPLKEEFKRFLEKEANIKTDLHFSNPPCSKKGVGNCLQKATTPFKASSRYHLLGCNKLPNGQIKHKCFDRDVAHRKFYKNYQSTIIQLSISR